MPPSDKSSRREFLSATSAAAVASAVPLPSAAQKAGPPYSREELLAPGPQRSFTGDRTMQIAMPVGGIGAGSVCFNGYGGLQDFSVYNRPNTSALPKGFQGDPAALRCCTS